METLIEKPKNEKGYIDIEIKQLINWREPNGTGCIASNLITKEGWKVGYMYREEPIENMPDNGWRFFKGDEDAEYTSNASNLTVFDINTICNYDPAIIPYLHFSVGTRLVRVSNDKFAFDDGKQHVHMGMQ